MGSELMPFLRCKIIGENTPENSWVIQIELASGSELSVLIGKDRIYDRRLCKIRIRQIKAQTAIVVLPVILLTESNATVEVSRENLEWHH